MLENSHGKFSFMFLFFLIIFLTLNQKDFWQFLLFIGLFIDHLNNTVSNLDRFVFLKYLNRHPDWVDHLGNHCFQVTPSYIQTSKIGTDKEETICKELKTII